MEFRLRAKAGVPEIKYPHELTIACVTGFDRRKWRLPAAEGGSCDGVATILLVHVLLSFVATHSSYPSLSTRAYYYTHHVDRLWLAAQV